MEMTKLRELCVSLGHADVETYLQSGNILLSTRTAQSKLGPRLSEAICKEFGYTDVDVLVWTAADLEEIAKGNPFLARGCDPSHLHVTFLAKDVKPAAVEAIGMDRYLADEFAPGTSLDSHGPFRTNKRGYAQGVVGASLPLREGVNCSPESPMGGLHRRELDRRGSLALFALLINRLPQCY